MKAFWGKPTDFWTEVLEQEPRKLLLVVTPLAIAFLLAITARLVGYNLSWGLFYLLPVLLVSWFAGLVWTCPQK